MMSNTMLKSIVATALLSHVINCDLDVYHVSTAHALVALPTAADDSTNVTTPINVDIETGHNVNVVLADVPGAALSDPYIAYSEYIGCYADNPLNHTLPVVLNGSYTVTSCLSALHEQNYQYGALQNGSVCLGSTAADYDIYGASAGCTTNCTLDPTQQCGGVDANAVYFFTAPYYNTSTQTTTYPNTTSFSTGEASTGLSSVSALYVTSSYTVGPATYTLGLYTTPVSGTYNLVLSASQPLTSAIIHYVVTGANVGQQNVYAYSSSGTFTYPIALVGGSTLTWSFTMFLTTGAAYDTQGVTIVTAQSTTTSTSSTPTQAPQQTSTYNFYTTSAVTLSGTTYELGLATTNTANTYNLELLSSSTLSNVKITYSVTGVLTSSGTSLNAYTASFDGATEYSYPVVLQTGVTLTWSYTFTLPSGSSYTTATETISTGAAPSATTAATVAATHAVTQQATQATVAATSSSVDYTDLSLWTLAWNDEFSQAAGTGIDTTKWNYDGTPNGGYNGDYCHYPSDTSIASHDGSGNLVLTSYKTSSTCNGGIAYNCPRITTQNEQTFTYGRFTARIKTATGGMAWPAWWSLGSSTTDTWPYGAKYEFDFMETQYYYPTRDWATAHFGAVNNGQLYAASVGNSPYESVDLADDYHVYSAEWTATEYRMYFDDQLIHTMKSNGYTDCCGTITFPNNVWPFTKPVYLILDVAYGGGFFGSRTPDCSVSSTSMIVDYVRVYTCTAGTGLC